MKMLPGYEDRVDFQISKSLIDALGWDVVIKRYFGPGMYLDKRSEARLLIGINVPKLIEDAKSGDKFLKSIVLNSLAELSYENIEDRVRVKGPSRKEISTRVGQLLKSSYFELETKLLMATRMNLMNIQTIHTSMIPFIEIIDYIIQEGKLKHSDITELRRTKGEQKVNKYMHLLLEEKIIRKVEADEGYGEGNTLIAYQEMINEEQRKGIMRSHGLRENDASEQLVGILMATHYEYLTKILKITSMMPYVRLANAYYTPSSYAWQLITLNFEELDRYHKQIYGRKILSNQQSKVKMGYRLKSLREAKILSVENKNDELLITGEQQVLDDIHKPILDLRSFAEA